MINLGNLNRKKKTSQKLGKKHTPRFQIPLRKTALFFGFNFSHLGITSIHPALPKPKPPSVGSQPPWHQRRNLEYPNLMDIWTLNFRRPSKTHFPGLKPLEKSINQSINQSNKSTY